MTLRKKLIGIATLILSLIGYTCGIPLVSEERCESTGGTYVAGICYPEGTTFDTGEQCPDGSIEIMDGCWDPWLPVPDLGE